VPAQGTISSPHVEKGEIAPEAGYLVVEGNPKGSLVVISGPKDFGENGKVETSMPFRSDAVPAGNYKVRVSYAGYDDFEKSVRVTADSTETIKVELVKSTGTLIIEGEPRGAKVEVKGPKGFSEVGGIPVKLYDVPRGTYKVSVSRDGYENFSEDAEVQGGKQEIVKVNLKKRGSGKGAEAGDMVFIPAGEFWMGCSPSDSECYAEEKPYHKVYIDGYYINKYEVTVAEFEKCVNAGSCKKENYYSKQEKPDWACNLGDSAKENHPMNCVTWYGAKEFCEWTGKRLPTEAEWEKAARGGTDTKYPWGNEFKTGMANCDEGTCKDGYQTTSPVGSFKANGYGLFDMIGNVWEWVNDWYDEKYYQSSPGKNPAGPSSSSLKVLRGGSWDDLTRLMRVSDRNRNYPDVRNDINGFRCAKD
jgi:formylglycine-generating enzyme required for sulfatase activity